MIHPYAKLPDRQFWRTGVSNTNPLEWSGIYSKKFDLTRQARISSAGSCFAQHIGKQLKARGFSYMEYEAPPALLPEDRWRDYNYGIYSARFANVYTARQLLQLAYRAFGHFQPIEQVVEHEGRYYDAFRPSIEPGGFSCEAETLAVRDNVHFPAVRRMLRETEVFIFTLGLTEAWKSKQDGAVFPVCPGTIVGEFDPARYEFHNFDYVEILKDMEAFIAFARKKNPGIKFILTVSPVPLTATACDEHVLSASSYSKSVLRAVAGYLYKKYDYVDYFPSYELVTAPATRGLFFQPNLREACPAGVDQVLGHFFSEHDTSDESSRPPASVEAPGKLHREPRPDAADVVCEEETLELVRT